jgi:fructokinase
MRDGVGLSLALTSDKPTCTATVTLDAAGSASYEFLIDGTATFDFNTSWLPDPERLKPSVLHIGTLVTIVEPASTTLYDWAVKCAEFAPVVFDPNVRSSVVGDRDKYRAAVEEWVGISSVVKHFPMMIFLGCIQVRRWMRLQSAGSQVEHLLLL